MLYLIDHPLLRERARSEYPERDRRTVFDWEHAKGPLPSATGSAEPRTLHWLFQRVFLSLAFRSSATSEAAAGDRSGDHRHHGPWGEVERWEDRFVFRTVPSR